MLFLLFGITPLNNHAGRLSEIGKHTISYAILIIYWNLSSIFMLINPFLRQINLSDYNKIARIHD